MLHVDKVDAYILCHLDNNLFYPLKLLYNVLLWHNSL